MKIQLLSLAAAGLMAAACAPIDDPGLPPPDGLAQCKADRYQRFIGRHRSELPAKPANEVWRVTCATCPVTMDYNSGRLNIFYDESSGVIREVKCG